MLKLGYKASAEQFAPSKLLAFSVLAEQVGFDSVFVSDHFQPWKHTDGHAPNALVWLGALGASTQRVMIGTSVLTPTFRYHPSVVAQAFGTLGAMFPGRVVLGVGTGEGLNEVPSTGMAWPETKERFARLREANQLIRKLWTEDRVSFEGQFYRTEKATIYDKPDQAGADLCRCGGTAGGEVCRPLGAGLHLHVGQGVEALHRDAAAERRGGAEAGVQSARRLRPDDRDEGVVRHRPRTRDAGHAALGGAGADARGEDVGRGSDGDGEAGRRRCRWNARRAAGSSRPTRTSTSRRSVRTSRWASGIWCSTRLGRTRSGSCGSTASRCCRSCGGGSIRLSSLAMTMVRA